MKSVGADLTQRAPILAASGTPGLELEEQLTTVDEFARALASGQNPAERIVRALRALDWRLNARRSIVLTAREQVLHPIVAHGVEMEQFRVRFGSGVLGRVAASPRPLVIPTMQEDPTALADIVDASHWAETRWSVIAVPFATARSNVGGVLAVYVPQPVVDFAAFVGLLIKLGALVGQAFDEVPSREDAEEIAASATSNSAFEYANMIGASSAMRQVYEEVGQVARTNATTLIYGESGTGKELVAHAIHRNSPRSNQPFVKVNCAALPETLFESELFGHEKGAFTGAYARKRGRFELAQGGTLFLDEIGELTSTTQAKLLRVLQAREFERLGGTETLQTDIRIVAATNRDLEKQVVEGSFRRDLFYRLNVFTITLPPLRDRRADIPQLAEYFLAKYALEHKSPATRISSGALDCLTRHNWLGNVRELQNVIERAAVICADAVIQESHLPPSFRESSLPRPPGTLSLQDAVARLERSMLEEALREAGGNCARAARALVTTERVVRYKVTRYGIDVGRLRGKAFGDD